MARRTARAAASRGARRYQAKAGSAGALMASQSTAAAGLIQQPLRVLGVDPGTRVVGWAVVEARGSLLRLTACGIIQAAQEDDYARRLAAILQELQEIVGRHVPSEAAVEGVFSGPNPRTALKIGEGRGVALAALGAAGLPVFEYSPSVVKRAATGRGSASKPQVGAMVAMQLGLSGAPKPADAADACAIALCHLHRRAR